MIRCLVRCSMSKDEGPRKGSGNGRRVSSKMADRTLRSAMKHQSRPSSPSPTPSPQSSPSQSSPIPALPQPSILSLASPGSSSPATTLNSPLLITSPSPSTTILSPSSTTQSPTASTIISPNAGQGYTPKVSFDTFENPVASMFSFTLQVKSDGYERSPSSRVFLCASSPDDSGRHALDWTIESLVQDGDELVVFRGIDQDDLGRETLRITSTLFLSWACRLQRRITTLPVTRPENFCFEFKINAWRLNLIESCLSSSNT